MAVAVTVGATQPIVFLQQNIYFMQVIFLPLMYKSKHYITDLEFLFFLFEDWRPLLRHYCLFLKTCVTLIWVEVSNRIY